MVSLALAALLSFAPVHVARYLVGTELDALGIEYDGLDTLELNPWTRKLRLGPVRFGQGPSDPGQLGELGLALSYNPLLQRRISIRRLQLSGIAILVARNADNALSLNGIPLADLLTTADGILDETTATDQHPGLWAAGVDAVELRDAKLIFEDSDCGDLEVEIERLMMTDFRTWEPEQPGRFELAARVNDIQLNWAGEARPFADNITLSIDSRTEQADVPKVVRFTGPWGLDRRDGTYDARINYQVTFFDVGRLEGQATGTIEINTVDYARAGVFSLALDKAKVDFDAQFTSSESGDFALQGNLTADLGPTSTSFADQTRINAAGRLAIDNIDATRANSGTLHFAGRPDIDLKDLALSGPIDVSVDTLLELLVSLQSLSAPQALSVADTGLGGLCGKAIRVPDSDVKIARLTAKAERFKLQSQAGRANLDLKGALDLDGTTISAESRSLGIKHFHTTVERLNLESGDGLLRIETAGSNALAVGKVQGPSGAIAVEALEARVAGLDLEVQTGSFSAQLVATGQGNGFEASAFATQALPEVQVEVGAVRAALTQSSIDGENGTLRWQAAADAAVESVVASVAQGQSGSLKFERAEISAFEAQESLLLAADSLTVAGIDLSLTQSLVMALLEGKSGPLEGGGASETAQAIPSSSGPVPDRDVSKPKLDVRRVQTLLAELGYEPGAIDGLMGRRTASAIRAFQKAEGLAVDGRLSADLVAALETRAAPPAADREAAPAAQAEMRTAGTPELRIGRLSLPGNPVIRFRDDLITPNVVVDARFSQLEVQGIDTQNRQQRTLLDLAAEVNELTQVTLTGWVTGLTDPVDLDLKAQVDNLQLATYSPYVAALAGVHLDGGRLDATAEAKTAPKAEAGSLQGEIALNLDGLAFQPLSEADAKRVTGTIGVPLQTAVGLLADADGRIALTLPITGTPSSPGVDIGPAVNKAIGGVLKKVFPPTLVGSILAGLGKGGAPSFEAIEFARGSAALTKAGRRQADALAKLLAQHPKLSLKLCGRASAKDRQGLAGRRNLVQDSAADKQRRGTQPPAKPMLEQGQGEHALHDLAVQRQRNLTRHLIDSSGVDAARISECRSTVDTDDQGNPRVEVSF